MALRGLELAVIVLIGFALSGCTGASEPNAVPSTASTTPPSRFGAPIVPSPADVSGLATSPCTSTLSASELRSMNFLAPGRQRSNLGAVACAWTSTTDDRLTVTVDIGRDLLVDSYRARPTPIFESVAVGNFPAVRQRTSFDVNTCTVTVGVSDRQALEVDWTGHKPPSATEDPCAKAEEAIALVVRKLPPQR
ncbi:DUF3558 domain-containing protein [Actinomycetospora sp. OC33-EN08]|uniref:DUF3558 domain-containing protein n=1 Tax=Actinomycetospora aurantiaca TaxID=3129233 RepID=A0ABU8MSF5_9PSEU